MFLDNMRVVVGGGEVVMSIYQRPMVPNIHPKPKLRDIVSALLSITKKQQQQQQ